jgi:hypothetical protein
MKKFNPTELKFLRASDVLNLANINTDDLLDSIRRVFGEGYFGDDPITNIFNFNINVIGNDYFLDVSLGNNKKFIYLDKEGITKHDYNECLTYSIIYDDNVPLNGSVSNPIQVPNSILSSENVVSYSSGLFSFVYVNGHPQIKSDYNINQNLNYTDVSFNKIRQGKISPLPKDINGKFNKDIVTKILWSDFKSNFCVNNDPSNCYIEFPLMNCSVTNKDLVLEIESTVNNNVNTSYYHIPKDVPVYNTQILYKVSDDSPNKIYLYLSSLLINDGDKVSFYFLEKLSNKQFSSNNVTISQFSLPFENLSSETLSYINVLTLDKTSGTLKNLSNLSSLLAVDVLQISLDGTININSGFLPGPDSSVYAFDYVLTTPLPISVNLDMPNNITFAGKFGGTLKIPNPTSSQIYNLYVKNIDSPELGQTFYNSLSKVTSQASILNIRPHLLIVPNTQSVTGDYVLLGQINVVNQNTINFSPSSNALTPYQNMINIAQAINPPPKWRTVSIYKTLLQSGSTNNYIVIPILPIITENGRITSIKSISMKLRVYITTGSNISDTPFTLDLEWLDGVNFSSTSLISSPASTSTQQMFSFGFNNLFNNNSLLSYNYNINSGPSPYFILRFVGATTNIFVNIDYITIFFEVY